MAGNAPTAGNVSIAGKGPIPVNVPASRLLLALGQGIRFFAAPHVQQLGGADLEISAETDIQAQHILLVQGRAVDAFEPDIVLTRFV